MSLRVSGFIKRLDYSDKFGNFTARDHTFGKKPHTYNPNTATYTDFEVVLLNQKDGEDNHIYTDPKDEDMSDITDVVEWLFDNATNLTMDVEATNDRLANQFAVATIKIEADQMIVDIDNNILPNKIVVELTRDGSTNTYTLWFNSSSFFTEYADYDTTIFIPVPTIDSLMTTKDNLIQLIGNFDIDKYNTDLNEASTSAPYTSVSSMITTWVSNTNKDENMQIRFTFVCYGPISNEKSILKQELRDYVLANSSVAEAVWETVLPEIFTATTFIMVPDWDNQSGGLASAPIYNPIAKCKKGIDFITTHIEGYSAEFVADNLEILPVTWQSLALYCCSNPNSVVGSKSLSSNLSDYMLVDPDSGDFIRLTYQTRDFILKMSNYLPIIEKYKVGDVLTDLAVETISNLNFLVFTSYNIKCKVLCKEDYDSILAKKKKEHK